MDITYLFGLYALPSIIAIGCAIFIAVLIIDRNKDEGADDGRPEQAREQL